MASFDFVNYNLRTNKNVERKLIFDKLQKLRGAFPINTYKYIGLGGPWFVDFIIAHKALEIVDMLSLEKDNIGYSRAVFNQPLDCIKVKEGKSIEIFRDFNFDEKPVLVWLDYDGNLTDKIALEDIGILSNKVKSGSIIIVTLNAHPAQLNPFVSYNDVTINAIETIINNEISTSDEKILAIEEQINLTKFSKLKKRIEALNSIANGLVPVILKREDFLDENFPKVVATILFNQFQHAIVDSGRAQNIKFYPLFNIQYRDNAPMVTVGGMIADKNDSIKLNSVFPLEYIANVNKEQLEIKVPPLTIKEKLSFDQYMPLNNKTPEDILDELELKFEKNHLIAYINYYKMYPVFGELGI